MSQYCGAIHDVSQSEHVAAKHDHLALSEICMEGKAHMLLLHCLAPEIDILRIQRLRLMRWSRQADDPVHIPFLLWNFPVWGVMVDCSTWCCGLQG